MMREHYKMGRTCAVTMEIAGSVSFLRERHVNLLQELDDRKNILIPIPCASALGIMGSDLTVLTIVDVRIRNSCEQAVVNWHC
jgi:hypothetical protein